jgi:tRNA dimethylallyltransferase
LSKVLVILGPTCVGKTQVSLKVADILNGEIVSFDSRQVYRFMDIGTAKPTQEERKKVPHHLVDFVLPDQKFNAVDYGTSAREIINGIFERDKQPIAVGGSGLYLKALTEGFFQGPKADPDIRERLNREAQEQGEPHLYNRLKRVDPKAAERIHPHDLMRIVRALEVFEITGKPITTWQLEGHYEPFPVGFIKIGLNLERDLLYRKIDQRVEEMFAQGLLDEVKNLKEKGYAPGLKAFRTVGYQELFSCLDGNLEIMEAKERIKLNTRHYAKRQMTWFRRDREVIWVDVQDKDLINRILQHFEQN